MFVYVVKGNIHHHVAITIYGSGTGRYGIDDIDEEDAFSLEYTPSFPFNATTSSGSHVVPYYFNSFILKSSVVHLINIILKHVQRFWIPRLIRGEFHIRYQILTSEERSAK